MKLRREEEVFMAKCISVVIKKYMCRSQNVIILYVIMLTLNPIFCLDQFAYCSVSKCKDTGKSQLTIVT